MKVKLGALYYKLRLHHPRILPEYFAEELYEFYVTLNRRTVTDLKLSDLELTAQGIINGAFKQT